MNDKSHTVLEIDGKKTLPLYSLIAKVPEGGIPAMGSAQCDIYYKEPEYAEPEYAFDSLTMKRLEDDVSEAIRYVERWISHVGELHYFFQFKDDPSGDMVCNLQRHTEIISALCDSKLGIDTTPMWTVVRETVFLKEIQARYRREVDPDKVWGQYARELGDVLNRMSDARETARILSQRIVNLLKLRAFEDSDATAVVVPWLESGDTLSSGFVLFYSYSHCDECLRDELERHLSSLKREGLISHWHDRRIEGGEEWKTKIDDGLESAHLILLLVSSDFLASDYCYNIEMKRALERHHAGHARVIPIILRSCDWSAAPFHSIQALPKDGMAVTSWSNQDEAFTDIAKSIRTIVGTSRGSGGTP
ncbi:MAG: toll/interleukin-1 receptor domain-containing protein [Planctomycetales bacterium]|nr:toll/interleukin-1 receptor domain-containing protein [Planctomycetales bacterium]